MRTGILLVLFGLSAFAQRRPLTPEDLWQWRAVEDPRISPDGGGVVFVEKWNDSARDTTFSHLVYADSKGKQSRLLTEGDFHDSMPRWSPDGTRVAFVSDRSGRPQIHIVTPGASPLISTVAKGEFAPLSIAWSPDSRTIAFTASIAADAPRPKWAPPAILPFLHSAAPPAVQLFVVPASGGEAVRLTSSDLDYAGAPAWMPDGGSLVCAAHGQIFNIRLADHAVRLLTGNHMVNREPVPSPDGSKVAWLAAEIRAQNYTVTHLWVMNADGSRARLLGGALDRDAMYPQWSSDSRTVYFLADDQGSTHLYAGRNDGTARQVTSRVERLRWLSLADNGRAVTVRSSANEGGNLITFAADLPGGVLTLAEPNDHLMAERNLGDVEELHWDSDGQKVQGWLVKPPHFDANRKYPLLLDIRDAPRAMYGVEFQLRAQIFASAGYLVLCANPRGTPGYGEEFGHLLRTRFPGDDADDLLRGVEAVLKRGYADEKRVFVAGGLVAAWLLGHSERFSGAVTRQVIVDWAADPDAVASLGVTAWDEPDLYAKRSPIYGASGFHAPTLVIAGAVDPQSDQFYAALQARKVESALVRIPEGKPGAAVLELQAALAWLAR